MLNYTLSGTATLGADYIAPTSFELVIPAGETAAILSLPIVNDSEVEDLESIVATVTGFQSVPQGVTLSSTNSAIAILWDNDPDLDLDGVSATTESLAANGGDGNLDGVPDKDQSHVTSLPNAVDSQIITLVAPEGTQFQNVFATDTIPENRPSEVDFPWGMLEFELAGLAVGGGTTVSLLLPAQAAPTAFYKYGPTAENLEPHWYDFNFDAMTGTGAEFSGNTVTLHFVDGGRGDSDLLANGLISDPGAVAMAVGLGSRLSAGGPYVVSQGSSVSLIPEYDHAVTGTLSNWEWDTDYDGQSFEANLQGESPSLATSSAGSRTVAVRATDESGVLHLGTTSLTVLNLPPVARADFNSTSENEPIEIDLLANDSDPGNDPLSIVAGSLQLLSATTGDDTVALSSASWDVVNGLMTFDPATDFDFLTAYQTATLIFEYSVQDAATVALTDTAWLTLTIQGENDAPSMAVGDPLIVNDATSFPAFRVSDFVGETAIVGAPSMISDADEGDAAGIMLHAVSGIDILFVSLDEGESFEAIDLGLLSINAAVLLPSHAMFSVQFSSTALGELSYLPWDQSFGSPLQSVDAGLLQDAGQLQVDSAVLKLVAVQSVFPTSVNEGSQFSATIAIAPEALTSLTTYQVQWTETDTTSVAAGEVLNFEYPDGPQTFEVTPTIIDAYGVAWDLDSLAITVENVAPRLLSLESDAESLSAPSSDFAVNLNGAFDDLGVLDTHSVLVDWGDGSTGMASVDQISRTFAAEHEYASGGFFEIVVIVTDNDGSSITGTTTAAIQGVGLVGETLWVIGTEGKDKVKIDRKRSHRWSNHADDLEVDVRLDGKRWKQDFDAALVSNIRIVTLGDKDDIDLKNDVDLPVTIDAGAGDDKVDVDSGQATVYGGPGRDKIDTADANDFVDGGEGDDDIKTAGGDDTIVDLSGDNKIDAGDGDDLVTLGDGDDDVKLRSGNDIAWLGGGDDKVDAGSGDDILFGQAGDDRLEGDDGNDILVGGDGDDKIEGDNGLDVLIGGFGADDLDGGQNEDLLIAGRTIYDIDQSTLDLIMGQWSNAMSYETRVDYLRNGTGSSLNGIRLVAGDTVFDDSSKDNLDGDAGLDWYFASLGDKIKRKEKNELIDLL